MRRTWKASLCSVSLLAALGCALSGSIGLAMALAVAAVSVWRLKFGLATQAAREISLLTELAVARTSFAGKPVFATTWRQVMFVPASPLNTPNTSNGLVFRDECSESTWRQLQTALRLQRLQPHAERLLAKAE